MTKLETTRLLIISTHKLFRDCLASMLAEVETFEVQEHPLEPEGVLSQLRKWKPAVILIDLSRASDLASQDVPALLNEIKEKHDEIHALVLGVDEGDPEVLRCIELGAAGYVSKESSVVELQEAIDLVLQGGAVCPPALAYSAFELLADLSQKHERSLRVEALQLTPREMEILQLIADGHSNKGIAEALSLSIYTVKNHVHHILDKLQVKRRAEAVEHAYQHHWLRETPMR